MQVNSNRRFFGSELIGELPADCYSYKAGSRN